MAYITGSITNANPGPALYTDMAGALTTAGFTLVDTVVISTRTHKIWKSAAANNTQALDWYLDVSYFTTGAGNLSLYPMEFYDPATDLAYRMVFGGSGVTTIDATTYSRHGATGYSLENANWIISAAVVNNLHQVQVSTSTFGYWISVTGDRVLVLTSIAPSIVVYAGLYTPTSDYVTRAGAALYPLVLAGLDGNGVAVGSGVPSSVSVAITRIPVATTINWGQTPRIAPAYPSTYLSVSAGGPFPFSAGTQLSPLVLLGATNTAMTYSGLMGTIKDVATTPSSGIARGDTYTIGADTWVAGSTSSSNSIAMRAI